VLRAKALGGHEKHCQRSYKNGAFLNKNLSGAKRKKGKGGEGEVFLKSNTI